MEGALGSAALQRLVRRLEATGLAVEGVSEGWSKVARVVHLSAPVDDALFERLSGEEPTLRCWQSPATPHDRAERGWTDETTRESVTLPR